jgi:hypothetical protein
VREKDGMSFQHSRYRTGAFLGFLCVTAFVLSGCGAGLETPRAADVGPSAFAPLDSQNPPPFLHPQSNLWLATAHPWFGMMGS